MQTQVQVRGPGNLLLGRVVVSMMGEVSKDWVRNLLRSLLDKLSGLLLRIELFWATAVVSLVVIFQVFSVTPSTDSNTDSDKAPSM